MKIEQHSDPYQEDNHRLRRAATLSALWIGVLWGVWIFEQITGIELGFYGIYPRETSGLVGILFAPMLHSDLAHIVSNSMPMLILSIGFLYAYPLAARVAIPVIYFGTNICVWLFARSNYHLGASGVVYGMLFFLLLTGILRRDRLSIAVSLCAFFLYGSMVWGVFPLEPGISFESHLAGAVIGSVLAMTLKHRDAVRAEKRYDWEDE